MTEPGSRERIAIILVFAVPPGIGVAGFTSMTFTGGQFSLLSTAAGLATALVIGTLLGVAMFSNPDDDELRDPV